MPNRAVSSLSVPQGKIVDFIDGAIRDEKPEEYVRQEIEKSLIQEYGYLREDMAAEFRLKMGSARKSADIAIFLEGAAHDQQHLWAIIECKAPKVSPNDKREGIQQLQSYMSACLNAEFGMWTNGQERICYQKVLKGVGGVAEFEEIPDIPPKGRESSDQIAITDLRPATSDALLFAFQRCHNYIAGNQGLQKPEAFWELLKLIFCKIEDERSDKISFFASAQDRQSLNGQMKVKARIDKIFEIVRGKYQGIFDSNEEIKLEPRVLAYLASQIQGWSLLRSDVDVKGKAYEEIVGSNLRGDRGEFFTPRNICQMAVSMLDPGPDDLILDPACGTGGFLTIAMNHVIGKLREQEQKKWAQPPSEVDYLNLDRRIREYADQNIVGIDLNPNLIKAAKMNMVMNNDGAGGLYQANSLEQPMTWNDALRGRYLRDNVDLLFTNPPYGANIRVDDPAVLEQFELGHVWEYHKDSDRWMPREPRRIQKSQPPEILFIERCVQFLKPGTGRMAIVLPDGILGAPSLGYVREWILDQTRVLASIDLHPDTFQPANSTQTSLLVLERKRFDEIELEKAIGHKRDYGIFMALANHIGHDKRGNRTFIRDAEGNELVRPKQIEVVEIEGGTPVRKTIEQPEKVPDDSTAEIAARFREWITSL